MSFQCENQAGPFLIAGKVVLLCPGCSDCRTVPPAVEEKWMRHDMAELIYTLEVMGDHVFVQYALDKGHRPPKPDGRIESVMARDMSEAETILDVAGKAAFLIARGDK